MHRIVKVSRVDNWRFTIGRAVLFLPRLKDLEDDMPFLDSVASLNDITQEAVSTVLNDVIHDCIRKLLLKMGHKSRVKNRQRLISEMRRGMLFDGT